MLTVIEGEAQPKEPHRQRSTEGIYNIRERRDGMKMRGKLESTEVDAYVPNSSIAN